MNEMRRLMEAANVLNTDKEIYQVITSPVTATDHNQDQHQVEVLTISAWTRPGLSQFRLALLEPEPVIVEYVGEEEKGMVRVRLISGGSQPTVDYVQRPYTSKKTGKTRPNIDLSTEWSGPVPLQDTYAAKRGEFVVHRRYLEPIG